MTAGHALADIHSVVERASTTGTATGLISLYTDDARMVTMDRSIAEGLEAIREQWAWLPEQEAKMTVESHFAIELGDLAILSNSWTVRMGAEAMSETTAEVARARAGRNLALHPA